jgi:hypothetical protein
LGVGRVCVWAVCGAGAVRVWAMHGLGPREDGVASRVLGPQWPCAPQGAAVGPQKHPCG